MPDIVILAGSESDLPQVVESKMLDVIETVGLSYSLNVASAHRNSRELAVFIARQSKPTKVYIGIAGMAAALPGAIAGADGMHHPVIAVPLDEHGIDSCLYMPPGVPVLLAGVGKTGLKNAAIAAVQIAASGAQLRKFDSWIALNAKQVKLDIDPTTIGGK